MSYKPTHYYFMRETPDPQWDRTNHARWRVWYDINKTLGQYEPGHLQARWRGIRWDAENIPNYRPVSEFPVGQPFPYREIELALLDAFVHEGGATAWSGDGSSCATQVVQNIWNLAQEAIEVRDKQIDALKSLLSLYMERPEEC